VRTSAGRRPTAVLGVLATLAIALAGCGGGDDTTGSTGGASGATGAGGAAPLSQEEFVSQADAICDDVNNQLRDLTAPTANDLQSIADYTQQGIAIVEPAFQQFEAITPPEDLQGKWDDYLSAAQRQLELDKQLQAAADAGDSKQTQQLIQQLQALDTDALAKDLGLGTCAEDTSPAG
jgi:hypothetical protein